MSLAEVQITSDVWLTCVTHALSTESEEIMGLLLGDIQVCCRFLFSDLMFWWLKMRSWKKLGEISYNLPQFTVVPPSHALRISVSFFVDKMVMNTCGKSAWFSWNNLFWPSAVVTQYFDEGTSKALIWAVAPQSRSDRRKDRVETNPEQLAAASAEAEISSFSPHSFLCLISALERFILD